MSYEQFAYVYDSLMEDMPYKEWIRFAEQCWDRYGKPKTVVDLGCGTGNIAIPLAKAGYDVTGIDLSSDMLAVARHKLEEARQSIPFASVGDVQWIEQDMREWELPHEVDSVISFCDCLNYLLEPEEIERTFVQVMRGLKQGGTFLFDVHTPYRFKTYAEQQPFVLNEEQIAYIWTCEWDQKRSEIEHELTIFAKKQMNEKGGPNGRDEDWFKRIEEYHVQRAYPIPSLVDMLKRAGFSTVDCYADFEWSSPTDQTVRAFFAARKGA